MGANEVMQAAAIAEAATAGPPLEAPPNLAKADFELSRGARFRHAVGNLCLALLFFVVLIPTNLRWQDIHSSRDLVHLLFVTLVPAKSQYHSTLATEIWLWGAIMMGVLSLVRVPPRSAMVNVRSILSTAAMMTIPALMRPGAATTTTTTTGLLGDLAIVVELIGIAFTQFSRIYLGRRFGLLPANRGIVSGGPFRLMRHPIYSGWLVLTIGYLMAYPSDRAAAILAHPAWEIPPQ